MYDIGDEKSTPLARAERLKRVRNLANLSRIDMCEGNDLNVNTLKGWEIARFGGLSKSGAAKVVARLAKAGVSCSVDWLLYEIGIPPQVNLLAPEEVTSDSIIIEDLLILQDKQKSQITEELLLFRSHCPKSLDYLVADESMLPHFLPGDIVAGVKVKDMNQVIGEYAIIVLENGKELLRQVHKGDSPGCFTLLASNLQANAKDLTLVNARINSMAPIIWHRKLLRNSSQKI